MTSRTRTCLLCLSSLTLLACKQDCVLNPCPQYEAVTVTVSTATSAVAPTGTEVLLGQTSPQAVPCDALSCHVYGGPGQYQLTVILTPAS